MLLVSELSVWLQWFHMIIQSDLPWKNIVVTPKHCCIHGISTVTMSNQCVAWRTLFPPFQIKSTKKQVTSLTPLRQRKMHTELAQLHSMPRFFVQFFLHHFKHHVQHRSFCSTDVLKLSRECFPSACAANRYVTLAERQSFEPVTHWDWQDPGCPDQELTTNATNLQDTTQR